MELTDTRDPFAPFEVVAVNSAWTDPAIDTTDAPDGAEDASAEERLERYRKTRNLAALVLKGAPTRFVLRPLSAALLVRYDTMAPAERLATCFLVGCHEVRPPEGPALRPAKLERLHGGARIATDAWIETVAARYGLETVYEMGAVVDRISRLPVEQRGPFC